MAQTKISRIAELQAKVDRIVQAPMLTEQAAPSRLCLPVVPGNEPFLPKGLPAACVHEIEGADWDAEAGIAASSFAAAMLSHVGDGVILWMVRQDAPFAPRLAAFDLDPDRVIFCRCRNDAETLAALEDALRTKGVVAAVGEVEHTTLTQSRRLHLICEDVGNTGLLLRRRFHGAARARKEQGSAAATRWRVHFAPTETTEPGLGPPRWRLDLLYRRSGAPASFLVEWDDEARQAHLVAKLTGRETEPHQTAARLTA